MSTTEIPSPPSPPAAFDRPASERPIFVAEGDRRARWLGRLGRAAAVLVALWLVALLAGALGSAGCPGCPIWAPDLIRCIAPWRRRAAILRPRRPPPTTPRPP